MPAKTAFELCFVYIHVWFKSLRLTQLKTVDRKQRRERVSLRLGLEKLGKGFEFRLGYFE